MKNIIEETPIDGSGKHPYVIRYDGLAKVFFIDYNDYIYSDTLVIVNGNDITLYEAHLLRISKFIKDCLDMHRPINTPFNSLSSTNYS